MKYRPAVLAAAASAALLAVPPAAGAAEDPGALPACTDVSTAYGDYEQDELTASVDVVPVLVAGGDWQPARASVTNVGERDLPVVVVRAYPWLQTGEPDPPDMRDYVKTEARTADGGWRELDETAWIDAAPLKSGETRSYELRVRVVGNLPRTPGGSEYALTGAFADVYRFPDTGKEVPCTGVAPANDTFRIERPATTSPTPRPTTPRPTPTTATPAPKPTRTPTTTPSATPTPTPTPTPTSSATPPTPSAPAVPPSGTGGEMAGTGTSDATVPLAAAAGALALLGGGAVVLARRRRR
ncbi:LPXTG cell wall anchor domain-containing protein [Streptomyces griseosporeus]|uniref:LPXTG cell wall anchor domain-containing protein n=1 Tax=Streptomyces griseosporeus TaxID=1910 RepID=UPI0036B0A1DE